ncbi:MAG: alcohol dehydrogenase catalytic domain-containing protein [bacterium]
MKAVVYRREKGLVFEDVPTPEPSPNQALVRIRNVGVCGSDLFFYNKGMLNDGYIMGHECSGVIAETGSELEGFKEGDRVIVRCAGCGKCPPCLRGEENLCPKRRCVGILERPGAFAEYVVADSDMLIPMPDGLTFEQAALAEPLATALHGIRVSGFTPGSSALVVGAGPIGLCAIILLQNMNASPLMATEVSEERLALAKKLGAAPALSPNKDNIPRAVSDATGGLGPDFIYDCAGVAPAIEQSFRMVAKGGRVTTISVCSQPLTVLPLLFMQRQIHYIGSFTNTQAECRECMRLMAKGEIDPLPLITDRISLEQLPEKFAELNERKNMIKLMVRMD